MCFPPHGLQGHVARPQARCCRACRRVAGELLITSLLFAGLADFLLLLFDLPERSKCSDLDLGMAELMQSAKRSSSSCPVLSRLSMERSEREELKLLLTFGSFPPLARSVTSDAPVEDPELPDLVSKRHQSTVLKSMDLGTDPTLRSCLNNIYNEFRCKSCTELLEFGCN